MGPCGPPCLQQPMRTMVSNVLALIRSGPQGIAYGPQSCGLSSYPGVCTAPTCWHQLCRGPRRRAAGTKQACQRVSVLRQLESCCESSARNCRNALSIPLCRQVSSCQTLPQFRAQWTQPDTFAGSLLSSLAVLACVPAVVIQRCPHYCPLCNVPCPVNTSDVDHCEQDCAFAPQI